MTFDEWLKEVVDGLNDRETIIRQDTIFNEEGAYVSMVKLRKALQEAYKAGETSTKYTYERGFR